VATSIIESWAGCFDHEKRAKTFVAKWRRIYNTRRQGSRGGKVDTARLGKHAETYAPIRTLTGIERGHSSLSAIGRDDGRQEKTRSITHQGTDFRSQRIPAVSR